ncbi:HD family phosphohydrolase [Anaerobacillus sp. MEB173]|uniref:HD family phosphohydrolase n=1 Tax=Anaerobacillus sp. MEB173 TaxID=3383345 RepID=UPI003F8EC47F
MSRRSPIDQMKWWKSMRDHRYIRFFLFFLLGIFLYISMISNVIPERFDVTVGSIVEEDIRSPITIENKQETEEKKKIAAESVEAEYTPRKEYAQNQVERINDLFALVSQINQEADQKEEESKQPVQLDENGEQTGLRNNDPITITIEERVEQLKQSLPFRTSSDLSDETLRTLLEANEQELIIAHESTTNAVFDVMSKQIKIDDLEGARQSVEERIVVSAVNSDLYDAMVELARFTITPNYIYDDQETERMRQAAIEAVEPVIIREGQILAQEGEVINRDVYDQLRLVGLLDEHSNVYPYIGLAILVGLLITMVVYYVSETQTSIRTNNTHLLMYIAIFFVTISLMKISSLLYVLDYQAITLVVPVAVGTMLITMLISPRVALFSSMIFAVCGSIIFNSESSGVINFTHGIYILFSSVAGVFFLGKSNRMSRILRAGLFVAVINVAIIISLLMLKNGQYSMVEIGSNIGFAFLSGFFAAVLTLGLMPFFEAGFGILSTMKLIELSSPNHPLLRKILTETPGTYHHSVIVGNLAEAACESIGANGLLARVGAYYHDLGKTKRPHFFIENQMKMDNPHDKISPQLSKTIIISHPYDGAEMLREHKMPKEIIDIAEQHHGTTLLKYFYHKANESSETTIPESQFRYPGPKAQTKVAAIVGIADCVEAAVRSMAKPTPDKIENLVRNIIADRLKDGQFNECDITLKELDTVAKSMCETLKGTFHSRIEYPEDIKIKEKVSKHAIKG